MSHAQFEEHWLMLCYMNRIKRQPSERKSDEMWNNDTNVQMMTSDEQGQVTRYRRQEMRSNDEISDGQAMSRGHERRM